jgi:hypothetical protein
MQLPFSLTLRGAFWIGLGLVLIGIGIFSVLKPWTRVFGIALLLNGAGCSTLGLTNGFSDPSRLGLTLYRAGIISFGVGLPALVYAIYAGSF